MKNLRKLIVLAAALFLSAGISFADNKPVRTSDLPQTAQNFITNNFGNATVATATMDSDSRRERYDVTLSNGIKIEFDLNGEWTSVKTKNPNTQLPDNVIPAKIKQYVNTTYPDMGIVSIEHERNHYEIELANDIEIKFNNNFEVVKTDY